MSLTAKLSGARLDYWVAKAEGFRAVKIEENCCVILGLAEPEYYGDYNPSCDWSVAGPIIRREKLMVQPKLELGGDYYGNWRAVALSFKGRTHSDVTGPSPLVAAMRCYVASVFGLELPPIRRDPTLP